MEANKPLVAAELNPTFCKFEINTYFLPAVVYSVKVSEYGILNIVKLLIRPQKIIPQANKRNSTPICTAPTLLDLNELG